ncbi:putative membrane protein [Fontibacillus solani]|uniref:Putative membrane protein n=2 Tax=Fontibacillus solani TaxID=1572857 RepID=A0A7W3SP18_9BACL|nr:putative membrane protein [Fontibacillus solani]
MDQSQQQEANKSRSYEVELVISKMLRIGVLIAGAVIVIGLLQYLITGESGYPGDTFPTTFGGIFEGMFQLKAMAVIETGLLLLILTPVFRVFVSLFVFWAEKDYRFVGITAVVLIILIVSFLLGKVG